MRSLGGALVQCCRELRRVGFVAVLLPPVSLCLAAAFDRLRARAGFGARHRWARWTCAGRRQLPLRDELSDRKVELIGPIRVHLASPGADVARVEPGPGRCGRAGPRAPPTTSARSRHALPAQPAVGVSDTTVLLVL